MSGPNPNWLVDTNPTDVMGTGGPGQLRALHRDLAPGLRGGAAGGRGSAGAAAGGPPDLHLRQGAAWARARVGVFFCRVAESWVGRGAFFWSYPPKKDQKLVFLCR